MAGEIALILAEWHCLGISTLPLTGPNENVTDTYRYSNGA